MTCQLRIIVSLMTDGFALSFAKDIVRAANMAEAPGGGGLWQTIKPELVKLLTVGLLGSILSAAFGFVTWVRDKRLARLEANIADAEQIHTDAIALAHERWYRGFRLLDELSQSAPPRAGHQERLKDAEKFYEDVVVKWNVTDGTLLSRIDMAVDSALGNSTLVSLRDISKVNCHKQFFQDDGGQEIPELNRLSVKTWHIAMSHCFIELNDAIQKVRDHLDDKGVPEDIKNFQEDVKNAQETSSDVYVNESLYRTNFLQRLKELKTNEAVYYVDVGGIKDLLKLNKDPEGRVIPLN
jgi:hypothetical protein